MKITDYYCAAEMFNNTLNEVTKCRINLIYQDLET